MRKSQTFFAGLIEAVQGRVVRRNQHVVAVEIRAGRDLPGLLVVVKGPDHGPGRPVEAKKLAVRIANVDVLAVHARRGGEDAELGLPLLGPGLQVDA